MDSLGCDTIRVRVLGLYGVSVRLCTARHAYVCMYV